MKSSPAHSSKQMSNDNSVLDFESLKSIIEEHYDKALIENFHESFKNGIKSVYGGTDWMKANIREKGYAPKTIYAAYKELNKRSSDKGMLYKEWRRLLEKYLEKVFFVCYKCKDEKKRINIYFSPTVHRSNKENSQFNFVPKFIDDQYSLKFKLYSYGGIQYNTSYTVTQQEFDSEFDVHDFEIEVENNHVNQTLRDLKISININVGKLESEKKITTDAHLTNDGYMILQNFKGEELFVHYIFHIPNHNPATWRFLTGVCATLDRSLPPRRALSAAVVLERVDDYTATVYTRINPAIRNYLFRARLEHSPSLNSIQKLPVFGDTNRLKSFVGIYEGKIVSRFKQNFLEVIIGQVFEDGRALLMMESNSGGLVQHFWGRVRAVQDSGLIAYFDRLELTNVHRITLYLDTTYATADKGIWGVYSGTGLNPIQPFAGRIFLKRIEGSQLAYDQLITDENSPWHNDLDRIQRRFLPENELFRLDKDERRLYFGGHDRDFLTGHRSEQTYYSSQVSDFAGKYFIYTPSTHQNSVVRMMLEIELGGKAILTYRENIKLLGKISLKNKYLTIQLEGDTSFFMLFHVGDQSPKKKQGYFMHHAFGTSITTNTGDNPVGRIVILQTLEQIATEAFTTKEFEIDSEEFDSENIIQNNLLSYLSGKIGRYIVAPKMEKDFNIQKMFRENAIKNLRKDRYILPYFNSACYLASTSDLSDDVSREEAVKHFYQAYLAGFKDVQLLQTVLGDKGFLSSLAGSKYKVKPEISSKENRCPERTFDELVDLIKKRALRYLDL